MNQHDHPRHKLQFWPVKPGSGAQAGMLLSPRGFDDSGALAGWMRANYPRSVKYQVDIARGGGDRP